MKDLDWRDGYFSIDPEKYAEFVELLSESNSCEIDHNWHRIGKSNLSFSAKFVKTSYTYRIWLTNDERRRLIREYKGSLKSI